MYYGYARISRPKQNIERQTRNILKLYPDAELVREVYTGTKFQGRARFAQLLRRVVPGDTIVFDSVSRMSRNAEEGFELYQELYNKGVNLVFLKENYINTDTYRKAMGEQVQMTGDKVDLILQGINRYLLELAKEQIRIAFEQSEKEVLDLQQRTKEGIQTARLAGKQIGQNQGTKLNVKKAAAAKEMIRKHSRAFGGSLKDTDMMRLVGLSHVTYYKYKREIQDEFDKK